MHHKLDLANLRPAPPAPRVLPRSLQFNIIHYFSSLEKMFELYGRWTMRARVDLVSYGQKIKKDDTFEVHGADAISLFTEGHADFADERVAKESELFEREAKIKREMEKLHCTPPPLPMQAPHPRARPGSPGFVASASQAALSS